MSYQTLRWAFKSNTRGARKNVLVALAFHANDDGGSCFPSLDTIAEYAGITPRGARKALRELEAVGLIQTTPTRLTSHYQLAITTEPCGRTPEPRSSVDKQKRRNEVPGLAVQDPGTARHTPRNLIPETLAPRSSDLPLNHNDQEKSPHPPKGGESGFAKFWEMFPLKVERGYAERAWQTAIADTAPEIILAALRAYPFGPDLMKPAQWLRAKRWSDEMAAPDAGRRRTPKTDREWLAWAKGEDGRIPPSMIRQTLAYHPGALDLFEAEERAARTRADNDATERGPDPQWRLMRVVA